jgi:O-glycosyl hydrolase
VNVNRHRWVQVATAFMLPTLALTAGAGSLPPAPLAPAPVTAAPVTASRVTASGVTASRVTASRVTASRAATATVPSRLAEPAVARAARAADPATTAATVRVRPDPTYAGAPFEGWGTSLAWFANATGHYPPEIRNKLADLVFGADGLNLNIARYNIGGGNAPDVPDYLRPGGAVEGWWRAPDGTTRHDRDWWDPADDAHWNLEADATQRWWVDRIKNRVTRWETFSNSPPYFQTVSGYVSGGFSASQDQIRADKVDAFAAYLVRVTQELEKAHGIKVDSLDPLNEPGTDYWSTTLGPDGNPTRGRQEGAHAGPALQQTVVNAVAERLAASGSRTRVSAMDETNPATFVKNWTAYGDAARRAVGQLNVHTYGTSQRTAVRDIAKGEDKPLWMSEVEGSWSTGQSFTDMAPGLGLAQQMVDDLRELEPTAWLFWQPVEDFDNMKPGGEKAAGMNWGSIQVRFDCTAADTLATCPVYTNTKFDTARNFTHYLRPGDRLLKTGDSSSIAALTPRNRLSVVYVNDSSSARQVTLDLSAFARVKNGTTVTPVVTSSAGALVSGRPVAVRNRTAAVSVPARSVTTLVVSRPVTGVAAAAPLAQPGHGYRLRGVHSGKSLTPSADGTDLAIRTDDAANARQLWTLHQITAGTGDRARYAVGTLAGDELLAVVDGALTLVPAPGTSTTRQTSTRQTSAQQTSAQQTSTRQTSAQQTSTRQTSAQQTSARTPTPPTPPRRRPTPPRRKPTPPASAQWILSTTGDGTYTLVNVATRRVLDVGGRATKDGSPVGTWLPNSDSNQLWQIVDETVLDKVWSNGSPPRSTPPTPSP